MTDQEAFDQVALDREVREIRKRTAQAEECEARFQAIVESLTKVSVRNVPWSVPSTDFTVAGQEVILESKTVGSITLATDRDQQFWHYVVDGRPVGGVNFYEGFSLRGFNLDEVEGRRAARVYVRKKVRRLVERYAFVRQSVRNM